MATRESHLFENVPDRFDLGPFAPPFPWFTSCGLFERPGAGCHRGGTGATSSTP